MNAEPAGGLSLPEVEVQTSLEDIVADVVKRGGITPNRVERSAAIQRARFAGTAVTCNAQASGPLLIARGSISCQARAGVRAAMETPQSLGARIPAHHSGGANDCRSRRKRGRGRGAHRRSSPISPALT